MGHTLPSSGVTRHELPDQNPVKPGYRLTVANDRPVLVDRSYRIVEVID